MKYTGLPTDLTDARETLIFLTSLEQQAAKDIVPLSNANYIDRSSVEQLFREKHLSSDMAFNSSSGALRGLLGRLDYLIVIDASTPLLARIRAIDLEDGAVRGVATCKQHGLFSSASDGDENCIRSLVDQIKPAIQGTLKTKSIRDAQAAQSRRTSEDAAAAAERRRSQENAAAARHSEGLHHIEVMQAAADKRTLDEANAKRLAEAAEQERVQQERQQQVSILRPDLDDSLARLQAAGTFWKNMSVEMSRRGQSLRTEVVSALGSAQTLGSRCINFSR